MNTPLVRVSAVDYHTAGEPFRIVSSGLPELKGETVLDKRAAATENHDLEQIRKLLVNEPRGHADMYGGFITEPNDPDADFGVLFWHGDGYSTACGHGTIALGAWAVDTGLVVADPNGQTKVTIDVPSGRVQALVSKSGGATTEITFKNVASSSIADNVSVKLEDGRNVEVSIAYGGANYASLDVSQIGLTVTPENLDELTRIGREIKWKLNESPESKSQADPRLNGIYGTIIFEHLGFDSNQLHQRNVTIYADGRVDRSPCGSGTAARIAQLWHEGKLTTEMTLVHDSIIGSSFLGKIDSVVNQDGAEGVIPVISGTAHHSATSEFVYYDQDDLGTGFSLR